MAGTKVALVVIEPAGENGLTRFKMAMAYATQLKKADADVQVFFDGPGITWLAVTDGMKRESPSAAGAARLADAPPPVPGNTMPSPPPTQAAPASIQASKAAQTLIESVEEALAAAATLGIAIRASGRAADRGGLREKVQQKRFPFVNEKGGTNELPRLIAAGYKILIF